MCSDIAVKISQLASVESKLGPKAHDTRVACLKKRNNSSISTEPIGLYCEITQESVYVNATIVSDSKEVVSSFNEAAQVDSNGVSLSDIQIDL